MIRIAVSLVIAAGLVAAIYYFFTNQPKRTEAETQLIALGASVYAQHCATCHGANGEGQAGWDTESTPEKPLAPPHDATGHTWEHADRAMFRYIKTGVLDDICTFPGNNGMPQFINVLSNDEIRATIAFMVSRWPSHVQEMHEAINREYNLRDDLLIDD